MKIAICGAGPSAIEAARRIYDLGADFKIFSSSFLGGSNSKTRELDENYPLTSIQEESDFLNDRFVQCRVLRVHKRFLARDEDIEGRGRMHDLFRVVYEKAPMKPDENMIKDLDPNIVKDLYESYESFEDFDFVINAFESFEFPNKSGVSGLGCLNEYRMNENDPIYYGLKEMNQFLKKANEVEDIVIIGSGKWSAFALSLLAINKKIRIVTTESEAFNQFFKEDHSYLKEKLKNVLNENECQFNKEIEQYQVKLRDWNELESYEKAKVPRPIIPTKNIEFYEGYNIISLDKLSDRPHEIFVSAERPSFRGEENFKTFFAKCVGVFTGHDKNKFDVSALRDQEPGYYKLDEDLEIAQTQIPEIFKDWENYFSKKEE